jgi:hypothetical protein
MKTYKVSEFKKIIKESLPDYGPKIAQSIKTIDAENNKDFYSQMEKDNKESQQGFKNSGIHLEENDYDQATNVDGLGMERIKYSYPLDKKTKDRIKAQMLGKDSAIQKDINDEDSAVDTTGNENYLEKDGVKGNEFDNTHRGLGSKNAAMIQMGNNIFALTDGTKPAVKHSAFTENTDKMKRLNFKQTYFANEKHIFSLIPEGYKVDGNKFLMKDRNDNEYLIEWHVNELFNFGHAIILEERHDKIVQESINKFKFLSNYNSASQMHETTAKTRVNENKNFGVLVDKAKSIMND